MTEVKVVTVGPLATNCYLLIDKSSDRGVLIDPGDEPQKILSAIQKAGSPVITHILLTHGHPDHIAAIPKLRKHLTAQVVVQKKDANDWIGADLTVDDGWSLKIGRLRLRLIATPGHTPGSVCFYLPEEGILFSGDTLFSDGVGRTDLPGGNHDELLSSLHKLSELPPPTIVCPGHGPTVRLGEELKNEARNDVLPRCASGSCRLFSSASSPRTEPRGIRGFENKTENRLKLGCESLNRYRRSAQRRKINAV